MSCSPLAARSRTRESCSSAVNSSPASTVSTGSCLTFRAVGFVTGTSKVLDDGTTVPSLCLDTGVSVLPLASMVLRRDELFLLSVFVPPLLRLFSSGSNGELPLWKGLSLLKGLASRGGLEVRRTDVSGSSILTVGVTLLLRLLRTTGCSKPASGSSSVSEALGCLTAIFRPLDVLFETAGLSTLSAVDARVLDILFFSVSGTGGGGIVSVSSESPLTVLS